MSNSIVDPPAAGDRDKLVSAMFASLIIQNTNMAMIFLGQVPNPQSGETAQDLENAKYFIDQLEMIEVKTKGNLTKQEDMLLKQSLTSLRLAFVEAVEHPQPSKAGTEKAQPDGPQAKSPATDEQEMPIVEPVLPGETAAAESSAEQESKKKFTKKY